jgi:putative transposase
VATLRQRPHARAGQFTSLSPIVISALTAQYHQHPGWTAQLHYDNLKVAVAMSAPTESVPSYATVRRYLKATGLYRRPRPKRATEGALAARDRLEQLEVRSYEVDHVNGLWHADFHHGSRKVLTRSGQLKKPLLLGVIDDRSRLVCHLQWYLDETAESLVHGVSQALQRRALPRSLMTDNGAAMLAEEFTEGLARLGILHQTTLPYSPYQNAKQESFWGRVEGRLMAMLEGEERLTLELLNRATQAWAEQEYHRAVHSEIGTTPLNRYLAGPNVGRECPGSDALRAAFRVQIERCQRRSDGTISLEGGRFEIPSRWRHLDKVTLRYARWDLRRVDLIDPRTGTILVGISPLDKSANADAQRRKLEAPHRPPAVPATGVAPLLRQLLADYAATGLPPAYLPTDEKEIG